MRSIVAMLLSKNSPKQGSPARRTRREFLSVGLAAPAVFVLLMVFAVNLAVAAAPPTDDTIFDEVRRRLANDPDVKGGTIDVDVKAGVVTLRGKVRTEKAKAKAERVAKKAKGVKSVVNQLTISPT